MKNILIYVIKYRCSVFFPMESHPFPHPHGTLGSPRDSTTARVFSTERPGIPSGARRFVTCTAAGKAMEATAPQAEGELKL